MGRKKLGRQAIQRVPSGDKPPPGTTQWRCGARSAALRAGERLPPCVQDGDEPDLGPQMSRVGSDRPQRLGRRLEQDGIDHRLVLEGHGRHLGRHGEDHMEIGHFQQIGLPVGQPLGPGQALALGTHDCRGGRLRQEL